MTAIRILAAAAMAIPAAAQAASVEISPQNPVVELSINEEVRSAPDVATFGTGVQTRAPTASEALRLNSAEMAKVVARLKSLGVKAEDIQTSGINLNAEYDYRDNTQVFRGYQASNQVNVKVRDIARLGRMLDALVSAGATNVYGPNFMLEDDSAAVATARERALKRGMMQARSYARAAGYSDVRLLVVNEGISGRGPVPMERFASDAIAIKTTSAPPVEGGQVGTTVSLGLTFEMTR